MIATYLVTSSDAQVYGNSGQRQARSYAGMLSRMRTADVDGTSHPPLETGRRDQCQYWTAVQVALSRRIVRSQPLEYVRESDPRFGIARVHAAAQGHVASTHRRAATGLPRRSRTCIACLPYPSPRWRVGQAPHRRRASARPSWIAYRSAIRSCSRSRIALVGPLIGMAEEIRV